MQRASNNYFSALNAIDVSKDLEKKGQFSYLSWSDAVKHLREFDPQAVWEVKRFNGLPYLQTDLGFFVEVSVTVQGVTLSQLHPVLTARNQPLLAPSCFDINSSIQRALVKCIALHGLGLNVYRGEDVPDAAEVTGLNHEQQAHIRKVVGENDADMQKLLTFFNVQALGDIPASNYERVLRSLQRRKTNGGEDPAAQARKPRVVGTQAQPS